MRPGGNGAADTGGDGGESRWETTAGVLVGVWVRCCEAVREGTEENDNQVFFTIGQAEVPARHVDVLFDFRLGPASHLFDGSRWAMTRLDAVSENIPGVVEMDEFLQAFHISIMKERLLEIGTVGRRHCCITRGRDLHLAVHAGRILDPVRVRIVA